MFSPPPFFRTPGMVLAPDPTVPPPVCPSLEFARTVLSIERHLEVETAKEDIRQRRKKEKEAREERKVRLRKLRVTRSQPGRK